MQVELKEFVSETLKQIFAGIEDAQKVCPNGAINPTDIRLMGDKAQGYLHSNYSMLKTIDFDIAVSVSKEKETKGRLGIFVGPIGVGAQGTSDSASSTINRIKFSVPVAFPSSIESK